MENQAILALVERIVNAPNNDARVKELMNFAPEALLHRAGLTHRSSLLESTLSYTGAMTVGMLMGASAALMLVPGARSELRARFRKSLDRLDRDEKPSTGLSREGHAQPNHIDTKAQPNHVDTKADGHSSRDPSTSMTGRSDGKSIVSAPTTADLQRRIAQRVTAKRLWGRPGSPYRALMDVPPLRFRSCLGAAALVLAFGCDPMTVVEPDAPVRPRRDASESSDANVDAFVRRDAGPCTTAAECDDGIFCNGTETCAGTVCQPGTPPPCDDMLACTVDTCDVSRDRCANTAVDADRDMHGDSTCVSASGEALGDDCDDRDARRAPGNLEVCDVLGIDEDCNLDTRGGIDMDGDGFEDSRCCNPMRAGQTTRNCGQDCVDSNRSVNPMGTETCNGIDDNCNGTPDEICICTPGVTRGCLERGVCAAGVQTCTDGLVWSACSIDAAPTDVCDGRDENCDGRVDEGTTVQCWLDVDGDGFADRDRAPENLCPDIAGGCPVNYTAVDPTVRGDCCDADPRAFEGQTQYFDTISFCGNFNFDCDAAGTETPRWSGYVNDDMQDPLHEPECLNAFSAAACARESAYQAGNPEWLSSSLPRCGEGGNLVNSCTWVYVAPLGRDACFFAPAGQRQPCR